VGTLGRLCEWSGVGWVLGRVRVLRMSFFVLIVVLSDRCTWIVAVNIIIPGYITLYKINRHYGYQFLIHLL